MVGTFMRAGLAHFWFDPAFPWSTLAVNLLGSFALGLLAGSLARRPDQLLAALVGTGVLGSLTTFSAFAVEAVELADVQGLASGLAYVGGSVSLGVGLAAIGFRWGRR